MVNNQWFVVVGKAGLTRVQIDTLPANGLRKTIDSVTGLKTIFYDRTTLVEDLVETFSRAVGDTRSLKGLDKFSHSGPTRHAAICTLNKKTGAIRVLTDRVNFSKIFCYDSSDDELVLSTHLTFLAKLQFKLSMPGVASAIANGTQVNNSTVFRGVRVLDRASIHEFAPGIRRVSQYWQYGFDRTVSTDSAKQHLKDAAPTPQEFFRA